MKHRHHLPRMDGGLFLTDGGIETTLIVHEGLDLPLFAAFRPARGRRGHGDPAPLFRAVHRARARECPRRRLLARESKPAPERPSVSAHLWGLRPAAGPNVFRLWQSKAVDSRASLLLWKSSSPNPRALARRPRCSWPIWGLM